MSALAYEYQDVELSQPLPCGRLVTNMKVRKKSKQKACSGPKSNEMDKAVEISIAAIQNSERLANNYVFTFC